MQFPHYLPGLAICVSLVCPALASPQQKLNIEEAIVFLNGAELTSSAKLNLVKGENEIIFTNVAGNVNSQSITVSASNGVVVEAATFQTNYLGADIITARAQEIKDSIEIMERQKKAIAGKIAVLKEQVQVLQDNRKVGGNANGLSVAELTKMLDLIGTRMEGFLAQQDREFEQQTKVDERLHKLRQQLDEEQKKGVPAGGQILVKFYTKEATNTAVVIDYVVPNAGWSPTYDIMADEVNQPIKLAYKANIYQNSGVSWNNVKLSLSTGNPNEGVNAPEMAPWYLAFYVQPPVVAYDKAMRAAPLRNEEIVSDPVTGTGRYESRRGSNLYAFGARGEGATYAVDGVAVQNTSINNYVTVDNAGVNTSFDIELPYTIPSDGKQHLVAVKKYELPATYRYFAAPKLDKDAFLQAQITKWEDLNLLPGPTNIFYEGTYVGQGEIDMRNVVDTMTISLGRDKKVVIKRERDTKRRSVKTIGSNVRESFAYSITVRNARKEPISLTMQDQMPVSNDKDIVIEDQDAGGATVVETTGAMTWNLAIAANETKKLEFGFTVKYPKGKTVTGLR